jgi:hypothetical protein
MRSSVLVETFVRESHEAVDQELRRIAHCLGQLTDDDVWWQPAPDVNSIGTIVRHLCGNLRQWFLHGIGGEPDIRDRKAEFAEPEHLSKTALLNELSAVIEQVHAVLDEVDDDVLLSQRCIQGFDTTGLSAIYSTVTHLEGHALQIAYITHVRLGETYAPFWKPATKQQGGA